jgi:uncharacterized membrane protein (GlpM family)
MPGQDLGKLESVHGIAKLYTRRIFIIVGICLAVLAFAVYSVAGEFLRGSLDYFRDSVGFFICGVIPLFLICVSLWSWLRKRRAELKLYEKGFTYLLDGKLQTCFWHEVENVFLEERAVFSPTNKTFVCNVQKRSGEDIIFTEAIADVEDIHKFIEKKLTGK